MNELYSGLQSRFSDKPLIEKSFQVRIYFQFSFRFAVNVSTNHSVTI